MKEKLPADKNEKIKKSKEILRSRTSVLVGYYIL